MSAPTQGPDFDAIAERARNGFSEMAVALAAELDGMPANHISGSTEAAAAIATGNLCQAVEMFFGMCLSSQLPFAEGRDELNAQVDTYWKQALTRHLTKQAKANIAAGKQDG